jgi:hypothetical protein
MKIQAPALWEGIDYRRMAVAESGGVYRFKTLRPIVYTFSGAVVPIPTRLSFRTGATEWMRMEPHRMTIAPGYAWNGNSVKRGYRLLGRDIWLGTPDFTATLAASLAHDPLFQFSGLGELPFSLATANDFYGQICEQNHFLLTSIYCEALAECSWASWGKSDPEANCITR